MSCNVRMKETTGGIKKKKILIMIFGTSPPAGGKLKSVTLLTGRLDRSEMSLQLEMKPDSQY